MGVALLIGSSSASAEEIEIDSETIIIHADFRKGPASESSGSLTVIKKEEIKERASDSFEILIGQSPNINFTSGASRAHYIQIRGIGERSQFVSPVNPSVGIFIDGIDFSQSALGVTLFDLSQIEIFKGPQGTAFGANGLAGVVNIQSNQPTDQAEAHAEITLGNYRTHAAGIAVGGPLIKETLLGRLSLYKNTSDGFMENSYLNRKDTQNIDELSAKAQLKWLLDTAHTIDINLVHVNVNNGYDAFTFDNSRTSHSDNPGTDAQKTDALSILSNYQISSKMYMESKLSFSHSDTEYSYDEDWSHPGEFTTEQFPYNYFDSYFRDRRQLDFDIRVLSDDDGKLFFHSTDWIVGAYGKAQKEELIRKRLKEGASSLFDNEYKASTLATYGQLDSNIFNRMTLVTGLRVEKWDAKYKDSQNIKINTSEVLIGGKVGLQFQQNAKHMHSIMLSKGYKPGGVNADESLILAAKTYATESLWNIDLGQNINLLGNALHGRINFFVGQRREQQIKSSVVGRDEQNNPTFTEYIANAGRTHHYGLEAELDYSPLRSLYFFTTLGLLKSVFDDYVDPNPDSLDVEGRRPAQSPAYQYNLGFNYTFRDALVFKTNLAGKGSQYFSNRHNAKADAYALVNVSLSLFYKSWTATLWARNISDEKYSVRGFGTFGNNPGKGYRTETYTQQGTPRTLGLTLSYDY